MISALGVVFIVRYVPETNGRSLEQIEADLKAGQFFPADKRGDHTAGQAD